MTHRNRTPIFVERSREMRHEPNDAEATVWNAIRNRQLGGFKFRRQYAIGIYIVDFYCAEARVVIELDGKSHDTKKEYEEKRDSWLNSHELLVLRVPNLELASTLEEFLEMVWCVCTERVGESTHGAGPSP